jgi:pimeloyl-ACP methyl ester carboxylesterase
VTHGHIESPHTGSYPGVVHDELPSPRTIDLGGPVSYREWDGPDGVTFILIHGLGGMLLNWVRVAPGLSGLGRTLALDLPGFGTSPLGERSASMMDLRRVVDGFIRALVPAGTVVLVGNSMGGALGLLEAAIEPTCVDGLVLTSPALPRVGHAWQHPSLALGLALFDVPGLGEAAADARIRRLPAERLVQMGLRFTTAHPESIPADVVALHVDAVRAHGTDPGAARAFGEAASSLLRIARRPDVAGRALAGVRCPVLLIHGRKDRLVPARYAEHVLADHPSWRGRILPDVGHVAQLEVPGRWLSEVADWYAERRLTD